MTDFKECVKELLLASGGDIKQLESLILDNIRNIQLTERVDEFLKQNQLQSALSTVNKNILNIKEGLPLANVIPSNQLINPINVQKTATDIVADIKSRCLQFVLDALDELNPLLRLEELAKLMEEYCSNGLFNELRQAIDKVQTAQQDLIRETVDTLSTPAEKLAKLNDMLVDAVNTGSQQAISNVMAVVDQIGTEQLFDYINSLDPREAYLRLQEEIRKRTQIGDLKGVQDLLGALQSVESNITDAIDFALTSFDEVQSRLQSLIPNAKDLFKLPENVINEAQNQINAALDANNYESLQNILTSLDNIQNNLLSTLQDLDPKTLMQKGLTLLNEALANADIAQYNRILDEMAHKLCSQEQQDGIPKIPNIESLI